MLLRAFNGDPVLRTATLERVRGPWEARDIPPLVYLKWSAANKFSSLAGVIAETQDPEAFVAKTGMPLELALLCEILINAGISFVDDKDAQFGFVLRGDDAIWSFGTEWLEAVAVGADLSNVVPRYLPIFLSRILSNDFPLSGHVDQSVRDAGEAIVHLWNCELRGEFVTRQEWRPARAAALEASESLSDIEGYPVADLVESMPWPIAGIAAEFPAICQTFLHFYLQALAAPFLPEQDRADRNDALGGARLLARSRADKRFVGASDEEILDQFPDVRRAMLAAQSPEAMSRMAAAKHRARPLLVPFLRDQMDSLLDLLRETPK